MGGSSCRKEKDSSLLGSYSGKFPVGVLFTGCFLKRQALSSPRHKNGNQGPGREVTQPRSQSWKVVDRAVSTTVKSAAAVDTASLTKTILGSHWPSGFRGLILSTLLHFSNKYLLCAPKCQALFGARGNKTDANPCPPGTYCQVGGWGTEDKRTRKYLCVSGGWGCCGKKYSEVWNLEK